MNVKSPPTAPTEGARGPRQAAIQVRGELSLRTAAAFSGAVRAQLAAGVRDIVVNLDEVKQTDAVGVAALFRSHRVAEEHGAALSVLPGAAVHAALLPAGLLDELPLAAEVPAAAPATLVGPEAAGGDERGYVARTGCLGLRAPTWDELSLFDRWAREPLLDQMVGSELLYRCRHLGPYHPDFAAAVLHDATALTLLVEPTGSEASPVGFVRLYGIHLQQDYAFLETAVATPLALRRGWGITSTRLFMAYALDVLGLKRIEAKAYAYNTLSLNALRRNGFVQEGVLRQARTYDGERWDIVVFSILEEEMRAQRTREQFPYMGFWE